MSKTLEKSFILISEAYSINKIKEKTNNLLYIPNLKITIKIINIKRALAFLVL